MVLKVKDFIEFQNTYNVFFAIRLILSLIYWAWQLISTVKMSLSQNVFFKTSSSHLPLFLDSCTLNFLYIIA